MPEAMLVTTTEGCITYNRAALALAVDDLPFTNAAGVRLLLDMRI